jgi:hypothetical protein
MVCVLAQVDTAATAAVVDGGYDDEFGEVLPVDDDTQLGSTSLRYKAEVSLPCQIDRQEWGINELTRGGYQDASDIVVVLHRPDLEALGMIDSDGQAMIYSGDRIVRIESIDGEVQNAWANPPMLVKDVEPAGYGLHAFGAPKFNLVNLMCRREREAAPGL